MLSSTPILWTCHLNLAFYLNNPNSGFGTYPELKYQETGEGECELGLCKEFVETYSWPIEEYLAKKRERALEEATPNFTFLIQAMSLLLRCYKLSEARPSTALEPFGPAPAHDVLAVVGAHGREGHRLVVLVALGIVDVDVDDDVGRHARFSFGWGGGAA